MPPSTEDLVARANLLLGRTDWRPGPFTVMATTAQHGLLSDPEGHTWTDLTSDSGRRLHGGQLEPVADAIAEAARAGIPRSAAAVGCIPVAQRIRDRFGADRVALYPTSDRALAAALAHARHQTDRATALVMVDDPDEGVPVALQSALRWCAADQPIDDAVDGEAAVAAVVVRPTIQLGALRTWCDARGCWLIVDETETALRLDDDAGGASSAADLRVLGPTIAGGLELGAVLGRADRWDGTELELAADPLAVAAADAMLAAIESAPAAPEIARIGERLRAAFRGGCSEYELQASLGGPPGRMALRFEAQDNADGPRIRAAFLEELARAGCLGGWVFSPPADLPDDALERAERALRDACSRVRTLLIEHNSYLSGGLRWPFPEPDSMVGQRGLAIYRFPGHGGVDVTADGDAARIAFAAGELGPVTSSGFFIPTLVRGDFEVRTHYTLERWDPQGHAACLGLFAQDQGSLVRYYAQHRSTTTTDHHVMASLCGQLYEEHPLSRQNGELRLTRSGGVVRAWHRALPTDEWELLGEHPTDPRRDMVLGAKIWCGGHCDGLVASLTELRIDGEIPVDQIPLPPIREDPRHIRDRSS